MLKLGKKKASNDSAPPADTPVPAEQKADIANKVLPSQGGSLLRSLLPSIAGGSMVFLLCGGSLYMDLVNNAGRKTIELVVANESRMAMQGIVQQLELLQQASLVVARDPHLAQALVNPDPATLLTLAENYRQALPEATSVRIVLPHQAHKDDTSNPPISFAQMEMIRVAEQGKPPAPEIHRANERNFISFATPVKQGEAVIATVYSAFDFGTVRSRIDKLQPHIGYLEWLQTFPGSPPLVVTVQGDPANKAGNPTKLDWGVTHWTLHTYPVAQANPLTDMTFSLWLIIGIGTALSAGLGLLSLKLVNRHLQANATFLAGHFQALVSRDKPNPHYTLSLFGSLAQTIDRMFNEYDAQLRQQSTSTKTDKRKSKTAQSMHSFMDDDDPLDISLSGDDNDLLGGADLDDNLRTVGLTETDALELDDIEIAERDTPLPAGGIPAEIFRAYDIRGIVGSSLTLQIAHLIGCAVGSQALEMGQRAFIVARDGRLSSEALQQALIEGLIESGQRVIDLGMVPTPVLYFATHTLDSQSGVMVTGSHNPPDYNGFKIVIGGTTLAAQQIQAIKTRIEQRRFSSGQGTYERQDILKDYKDRITHDVVLAKPMRVVIDCGNGVGGVIFPQVLDRLGCTVTTLFGDVDGHFPNHHPDPSIPENLTTLIETVRSRNADIGIAIDGDADRIGVVTKQGLIIWPDRLLMLFARDLLSRNPGADVVYDVKCTRDIVDLVSSLGGRAILSATGHSLMKAKMKETGAVVGGELSGHIFFNDRWYGFDDGIYAAARLLEILSMEPFDADEVFAEFPSRVNTPEIKIPLSETRKFTVVEKLSEQGNFAGGNMVKIDGVRVDYPNGWGLIRASNTTPNLIARFEGDDDEALQSIMQRFREQLRNVEPGLNIPF